MRGHAQPFGPSRIKGQQVLLRRLRTLVVASHRYGAHRAATREEQQFAGLLFEGLRHTLDRLTTQEPRL
jgi:hypothetical protein